MSFSSEFETRGGTLVLEFDTKRKCLVITNDSGRIKIHISELPLFVGAVTEKYLNSLSFGK